MGALLPDRHPNRDFFIVDLSDALPRDDMASMEHPVFSLSTKPDMRELEYRSANGNRLTVSPSAKGLATIMDKDILLYCISKLVAEKNAGRTISRVVEMSAHEVMVACNWRTNDAGYRRFRDALFRLRNTAMTTDIQTGDVRGTKLSGLISEAAIIQKKDGEETVFEDEGRMSLVRIELSEWLFRSIDSLQVLTINRLYYRLRRPLERRLYEIARKHVGSKSEPWSIGIEKLQAKVGTNAPLKKFRFNLKEIIRDGNIPDYGFELDKDMVRIQRLVPVAALDVPVIPLRADTIDKGQQFAQQLRMSVSNLIREWTEWTQAKGGDLKSPDGAFIAFCQQKVSSRPGELMAKGLDDAQQMGLPLHQVLKLSLKRL